MVTTDLPSWSGAFWLSDDGQTGFMTIDNEDDRRHPVPAGFTLEEVQADDECETWIFARD